MRMTPNLLRYRKVDLLTVSQAAVEIGCSSANLRAAIERGALKATKYGPRAWMIERAEVERYKSENKGNVGRPKKTEGS